MFQPRQLFQRSSSAVKQSTATRGKVEVIQVPADRHPAMRGLNISPVHGHHCICGRCDKHTDAA